MEWVGQKSLDSNLEPFRNRRNGTKPTKPFLGKKGMVRKYCLHVSFSVNRLQKSIALYSQRKMGLHQSKILSQFSDKFQEICKKTTRNEERKTKEGEPVVPMFILSCNHDGNVHFTRDWPDQEQLLWDLQMKLSPYSCRFSNCRHLINDWIVYFQYSLFFSAKNCAVRNTLRNVCSLNKYKNFIDAKLLINIVYITTIEKTHRITKNVVNKRLIFGPIWKISRNSDDTWTQWRNPSNVNNVFDLINPF